MTPAANKLSSLLEREESPDAGAQSDIDALVSSPIAPPNTALTQHISHSSSLTVQTPHTVSRLYPNLGEMHPSKVQRSTTKRPYSDLRFGFRDISKPETFPSKTTIEAVIQETPTKVQGLMPSRLTSPNFEFNFTRPESDLSVETQRIMDSVREEAAKIKAQIQAERETQAHKDIETEQLYGVRGRKIAKAKGKAGRYSDAHKQEFKKMDSIAGHVSAWKNNFQANATSLKRTKSKASLDEPEEKTSIVKSARSKNDGNRLENTAPGKRARQNYTDDISTARPISRDGRLEGESKQSVPATARSKPELPSAVTTPTKVSLARATSVKSTKTSLIPSLHRSASTKTLGGPTGAKTEGSNKYLSSLAKFGNMKSILHRPQPKFSDDPLKVAAGTHLPTPKVKADTDKQLPNLPAPNATELQHSPSTRRVNFTSSTKLRHDLSLASKIPAPNTQPPPSNPITYPSLSPNPPNPTTSPGTFTFRPPGQTLSFNPTTTSTSTLTSPLTIRHVRSSGVATPHVPAISYGLSNKKRRRSYSETENHPSASEEEHRFKRLKSASPEKVGGGKRRITGVEGTRRGAGVGIAGKEKGRGVLSLSRLNVLARPKQRG